MLLRKLLRSSLLLFVLSLPVTSAMAEPENGWWWNPNESGRGFFIEMRDGVVYVGGYFYEGDGRATWMTAGGRVSDPYRWEGTLQSYRGGQTLFGDYTAPSGPVDVGPIALQFTSDTKGTLTWPGGTVPIERHVFGTGTPAFQPHTGWWWNPAESGRGFSVELQGTNLFVVAFMYDESGNPVWHFSAGPMTSAREYEGEWLQFAGGQTMGGAYRPPGTPTPIGRLRVQFTGEETAALTFTPRGAQATSQTIQTTGPRTVPAQTQFGVPNWAGTASWPYWEGTFVKQITHDHGVYRNDMWWRFKITFLRVLRRSMSSSLEEYKLEPGSTVRVIQLATLPGGCTQSADATFQLGEDDGELIIDPDLTYYIRLSFRNVETIPMLTQCPGAPPITTPLPVQTEELRQGHVRNYYVYPGTFGTRYSFTPVMKASRLTFPTPEQWLDVSIDLTAGP